MIEPRRSRADNGVLYDAIENGWSYNTGMGRMRRALLHAPGRSEGVVSINTANCMYRAMWIQDDNNYLTRADAAAAAWKQREPYDAWATRSPLQWKRHADNLMSEHMKAFAKKVQAGVRDEVLTFPEFHKLVNREPMPAHLVEFWKDAYRVIYR